MPAEFKNIRIRGRQCDAREDGGNCSLGNGKSGKKEDCSSTTVDTNPLGGGGSRTRLDVLMEQLFKPVD